MAPILFALAGAYAVTFTLQWASFLELLPRAVGANMVTLDPLPNPLDKPSVALKGTAKPLAIIEVGIDDRVRTVIATGADGRFSGQVVLPPSARLVRVQARDEQFREMGRAETPVAWKAGTFPHTLELCLELPEQKLLWVAGSGTPGDTFRLAPIAGVIEPIPLTVDEAGVFDALIPLDSSLPQPATVQFAPRSLASPLDCRRLEPGENVPLARSAVIDLRPQSQALAAMASEDDSSDGKDAHKIGSVLSAFFPIVQIEITAPVTHPYFSALVRGDLPVGSFLEGTFGELDVLDAEALDYLQSTLKDQGLPMEDLGPRTWIEIEGAAGTAHIQLRVTSGSWPGGPEFRAGSGSGIRSRPLLSARDSVTMQTPKDSGWTFQMMPVALKDGEATWSGPLSVKELSGAPPAPWVSALARLRSDLAHAKAKSPANMKELLSELSSEGEDELPLVLWRTLLALVPALTLWMVARRDRFAAHPSAPLVTWLTASVALWQAWPLLHELAGRASSPLGSLVALTSEGAMSAFFRSEIAKRSETTRWLTSMGDSCSGIVLVAAIALTPLCLQVFDGGPAPQSPRLRDGRPILGLRRASVIVRAVYALAVLATVVVIYRTSTLIWISETVRTSAVWNELSTKLQQVLPGVGLGTLVAPLLWAALLVPFGLRGLLLGVVHLAVVASFSAIPHKVPGHPWQGIASFAALAVVGAAALPLLLHLLAIVLPALRPRANRIAVVGAFVVVSLAMPRLPVFGLLIGAAALLGLGVLWTAAAALGTFEPLARVKRWMNSRPFQAAAAFIVVGVALGWPVIKPGGHAEIGAIADLMHHWTDLFPFILAIAFALLLWDQARASTSRIFPGDVLSAAALFYAAFLIGPTTTWLHVPVPLIVALLARRSWLFNRDSRLRNLEAADQSSQPDTSRAVASVVEDSASAGRIESAIEALNSSFEKGQTPPAEYAKRMEEYRQSAASQHPAAAGGTDPVFALGETEPRTRLVSFLRTGLFYSSLPIIISLYQYLPTSRVSYPFPVAAFVVFLLLAVLKWALYAFFVGLFFANLAGATGLSKGLRFFIVLGLPFAVQQFLGATSLGELRPFLLWLAQLFLFCGLLGLVASDLKLLRDAGFRVRDLRAIHRLSALSAFASTALAAIFPAVLAVFAGKAGDLVQFFIKTMITGSSPAR